MLKSRETMIGMNEPNQTYGGVLDPAGANQMV
jgi:hypothetical protein